MKRNHRPHGPAYMGRALNFEEVREHRNICCGLYGICLEVVVRRKWPSFSCQPCSLWADPSAAQQNSQGPARVLPISTIAR